MIILLIVFLLNFEEFTSILWGWRKERIRQQILGWPEVVATFQVTTIEVEIIESSYNGKEIPMTIEPYTYQYKGETYRSYAIMHPELHENVSAFSLENSCPPVENIGYE